MLGPPLLDNLSGHDQEVLGHDHAGVPLAGQLELVPVWSREGGVPMVHCVGTILMGWLGLELACAGLSQVCLVGMARGGAGLGHGVLNRDAMA